MNFHGNTADRKNDLLAVKTAYAENQKSHFQVERSTPRCTPFRLKFNGKYSEMFHQEFCFITC